MTDDDILAKLADANGAILWWQVRDIPAFENAVTRDVITFDPDSDCFVHPYARKVEKDGAVAYLMQRMQGVLRKEGFAVYPTGGGCTAWRKEFADGTYALITSDCSHDFADDETVDIGFYSADGEECAVFTDCKPSK